MGFISAGYNASSFCVTMPVTLQALKSRHLCFWAKTFRENKGKWKRVWVFVKSPGQHAEKQRAKDKTSL